MAPGGQSSKEGRDVQMVDVSLTTLEYEHALSLFDTTERKLREGAKVVASIQGNEPNSNQYASGVVTAILHGRLGSLGLKIQGPLGGTKWQATASDIAGGQVTVGTNGFEIITDVNKLYLSYGV